MTLQFEYSLRCLQNGSRKMTVQKTITNAIIRVAGQEKFFKNVLVNKKKYRVFHN